MWYVYVMPVIESCPRLNALNRMPVIESCMCTQVDVLGGGRIEHKSAAATVHVFGYSSAFGPAPHEVAAALLRRWLPLHTVTTSYEGY